MATPGKSIDEFTRRDVERHLRLGKSVYATAKETGVSRPTVRKIRKSLLTSFHNSPQQ